MNARKSLMIVALLIVAVPAWAHCGKCGVGGSKNGQADSHAGHDHAEHAGHDHAEHGEATTATLGQPAPDFTLTGVDSKTYKLSDMKGKVVVLEWTNHTCPFVIRHQGEKKTMQKTFAKFDGKPVAWFGIDSSHYCMEKIDGAKAWVKKNGVTYPILMDASGKVGHMYDAKSTPHMFVIDQQGNLAYTGAIDDDPMGSNDDARNYVEEAVTSLLKGSTVAVAKTKQYGCSVKYKK